MQNEIKQKTHMPIKNRNKYSTSCPLGRAAAETAPSSISGSSQATTDPPTTYEPIESSVASSSESWNP